MPSEFLLDANTAIYFIKNFPKVRHQFGRHALNFLPFVTAAELLFGAKASHRREENLRTYTEFISRLEIIYPDKRTLEIYSELRAQLKRKGRPIPLNDVWQAAIALQYDGIHVTSDEHFSVVSGLKTVDGMCNQLTLRAHSDIISKT